MRLKWKDKVLCTKSYYLRVPFERKEFSLRSPRENRKASNSRLMATAMMRLLGKYYRYFCSREMDKVGSESEFWEILPPCSWSSLLFFLVSTRLRGEYVIWANGFNFWAQFFGKKIRYHPWAMATLRTCQNIQPFYNKLYFKLYKIAIKCLKCQYFCNSTTKSIHGQVKSWDMNKYLVIFFAKYPI